MPSDLAIQARALGKAYEIYRQPVDRVKQFAAGNRRKYYDDFWAVKDLDLDIRQGESVGIIGRNGSGKSTLLQMVCGIVRPTTGTLTVNGRMAAMLSLGAGFAPELTGRENVYIAGTVLGLTTATIRDRFDSIVAFADIGPYIDQPVRYYSSGMHARLSFAIIAHVDADILVIDEALSVGDAVFGQKCVRFIRDFRKRGTVLFVSHDLGAVANLCERTIWLDRGAVGADGETPTVIHRYLASLYESKDTEGLFQSGGGGTAPETAGSESRHAAAAAGTRQFNSAAPWFGLRGATIIDVTLTTDRNVPLSEVSGGESAVLRIVAKAERDLSLPIAGFIVHDRFAQEVFIDNTFMTHCAEPIAIPAGREFVGEFRFEMPYLKAGHYSICVSVAEGTQDDHVQHHWIDGALTFESVPSQQVLGIFRAPMQSSRLRITGDPAAEPADGETADAQS